ncbi:MAG: DEAD/DEAH box helicase family protein [Sedimenticola sp.]
MKAADPLSTLLSALDVYCYGSSVFAKRVVLSCRRPTSNKQSFHVVFPDAVFKSVSGEMKIFVLGFVRWLVEEYGGGASLTYEKTLKNGKIVPMTVVDTAVYTSNRNFRMLGQSKMTDKTRTPMSMEDATAAATDTVVQHEKWIPACDATSSAIESVMDRRRPADRAYPALPVRRECRLRWKTAAKTTDELVLKGKRAGSLTVRSAEDIANAIDSRLLRQLDYSRLFVPVLASLCVALSDDFLLAWIGSSDETKARRRLEYCRKQTDSITVAGDAALTYLKRVYAKVTDARFDARVRRPLLVPIEPAVEHGWTPVEAGEAMRLHIQNLCSQDNKSVGTKNEIRRMYAISGKMGAGKTKAVLEFTVDWLKRGVYTAVTYLGPRRVLVESVAQRVEQLDAERKGVYGRSNICAVVVDRIYHDAPRNDKPVENKRTGVFTAACVNSVHKTPMKNDVVIVDELATDVGNVFLNWSQMLRIFNGDSALLNCEKDKCIIDSIAARMRNARVVFVLEAALPRELMHACLELRRADDVPLESYVDGLDGDAKQWKAWFREQKRCPDTRPMMNPETKDVYRLAKPIKLAVYDPRAPTAIFTRLEEFPTLDELKTDILSCAIGERKKRAVVYVSSSKTGVQLTNMLFANHFDSAVTAPKVLTVSAATMTSMGRERTMKEIETCRFLIVGNVLSSGYSFEAPDVFDVAYAVFEFSSNTPPLADMIQLCARVRCVGDKVLKYTVVSHPYAPPKQVELEKLALEHRRMSLNRYPGERALHDYHVKEFQEHRRHRSSVAYARPCVREALFRAFSHADTAQLKYKRPALIVHDGGASEHGMKAASYQMQKYQQLLKQLPPRVVVAGFRTRNGKTTLIPNIESTRDDYYDTPSTTLIPLVDGRGAITDRVVARNPKRKLTLADKAAAGLPEAKRKRRGTDVE